MSYRSDPVVIVNNQGNVNLAAPSSSFLSFMAHEIPDSGLIINGNTAQQAFRCNATLGEDQQREDDQSSTALRKMSKEIADLTLGMNILQKSVNNIENTIQPLIQILPELVSFLRKNSNSDIEKDPLFKIPTLPFTSITDVEEFNGKLMKRIFSDQMLIYPERWMVGK